MNRSSPINSNRADDQDGGSRDIKSDAGVSSQNKEENKSQQVRVEPPQPQGLYLNLATALAYSIMKNIPPEYRLLEKTYLKKNNTRKRTRADFPPKVSRKTDMATKQRAKRQRESKNAKEYISSEYIDQLAYMGPTENLSGQPQPSFPPDTPLNKVQSKTDLVGSSTDSRNREGHAPRETFDEANLSMTKGTNVNNFENIDLKEEKSANDELPVSQMKIKLEKVAEDGSSPHRRTSLPDPPKEIEMNEIQNHSQPRPTIPTPANPAATSFPQRPPETHTPRLKADEEHFDDGDDTFSTQAILSAYTKKSEKLFNHLNEAVTTHSRTSVKERVELIKRYYSRMKDQDRKYFHSALMSQYNIDLTYFDI